MKKIWILAGFILLFVFLLFSWIFIGGFGDFANLLGNKSGDIIIANKTDFIGIWECEDSDIGYYLIGSTNRYVFSTNGKGTFGGVSGTWALSENKLNITTSQDEYYDYNFKFDTDKTTLILELSEVEFEFLKILSDS